MMPVILPQMDMLKKIDQKCSGTNTFHQIYGFTGAKKPRRKYKRVKIENRWIYEHRHIIQQHLGRKLERWEHVHHINGNSLDNRLENLCTLSNSEHQKEEYQLKKSITSSFSS